MTILRLSQVIADSLCQYIGLLQIDVTDEDMRAKAREMLGAYYP